MKKCLLILLLIAVICCVTTSCDKVKNITNNTEKSKIVNDKKLETLTDEITYAKPFSNGYAFVSSNPDANDMHTYTNICINAQRKIVFKLPNENDFCHVGFNKNHHAYVSVGGKTCLINENGEVVISPEKNGYTSEVSFAGMVTDITYKDPRESQTDMHLDGYFPVCKENRTYQETTYEFGVIGKKGEWILPLSGTYFDNEDVMFVKYFNNYIEVEINDERFLWNLKDGTLNKKKQDMDDITANFMNKHENLIMGTGIFQPHGEYASACFWVDGFVPFFTIANRNGEYLFEPIQIRNSTASFSADTNAGLNERLEYYWAFRADGKIAIYNMDTTKKLEFSPKNKRIDLVKIQSYSPDEGYLIHEYFREGTNNKETYYFVDSLGKEIK